VANDILDSLLSAKRDRFIDVQSSGGEGRAYYADQHVQALLKLMQQKEYGRILAKPKVLVNDNEEGTISTTRTTYVQKTSSIPVTTGTAGTSGDLIQTSVDYADYQDGIELAITPHISEGDLLRLEITLNRQDFGTITGEKPPDTVGSDLNTIVTVPDGSTIILGGMIKLNQSKGGTKVPILGDIPFLGTLFRSVSNSDIQTKLYVFVKAEIIRPAKDFASGLPDLEEISMRNRKAFETFEERFQKYENIPGMKSGPMDPLKVLDAQ
jgi:general secretion pathway protein D